MSDDYRGIGANAEETDAKQQEMEFGKGGVPWLLLLFYLSFLVFFTWYTLEYQLPDFQEQGPITLPDNAGTVTPATGDGGGAPR